jgi:hypothetical protein
MQYRLTTREGVSMKSTYNIQIVHGSGNFYPNNEFVTYETNVIANDFSEACNFAEKKYFEEELPCMTNLAKIYGMSFYQI